MQIPYYCLLFGASYGALYAKCRGVGVVRAAAGGVGCGAEGGAAAVRGRGAVQARPRHLTPLLT